MSNITKEIVKDFNSVFENNLFILKNTTNEEMKKYVNCIMELRILPTYYFGFLLDANVQGKYIKNVTSLGFTTSQIKDIQIIDGYYQIKTRNSIYKFEIVEK